MRNAFFSILPVSLCIAILLSTVLLHPAQRRPKMLGADLLKLDDAVRLVQNIQPVSGGNFLENVRSAVLALEAIAAVETCLVPEAGEFVFFDHPVFLISHLSEGLSSPRHFSSLDIGSDNPMSFFHVLDPPPPKNS